MFTKSSFMHFITRFILVFFYALTSHTVFAEDAIQSAQIKVLQSKVKVLESELLSIKALLNEKAANQSLLVQTISAPDKLILKSGDSMLELTKRGKITLKGVSFDIQTEQDQIIKGTKINNN